MKIPSRQPIYVALMLVLSWDGSGAWTWFGLADDATSFSVGEFERNVAPILVRNCLECHRGSEPNGGLDLSSKQSMANGGESGRVVDSDDPKNSLLWQKISDGEMPPDSELPAIERSNLLRWIEAGAPRNDHVLDLYERTTGQRAGYDWWSLQPIVDPPVPVVSSHVENPIDAFVMHRLRREGLRMSPPADARTLVRRLMIRLHGIHPDAATVQRMERNNTSAEFRALIDEALDSHRYGERWARHWLDLARYGESQGFERDKSRPNSWRYRDWVIGAINDDMPYDQFAKLQIAGDCLPDAGRDGVVATGFLVAGAWDEVGQNQQSAAMKKVVRQDEMEDYVGTVGQTFLGLTTNCARCHDHKFDPIRQSEYYALCSALDGVHHGERDITPTEVIQAAEQKRAERNSLLQVAQSELAALKKRMLAGRIHQASLNDRALDADEVRRLAGGARFIDDDVLAEHMTDDQRKKWTHLRSEIQRLREQIPSVARERTYAVKSSQPKQPTRVLLRGNPGTPGDIVSASGIASMKGTAWDFDLPPDAPEAERRRKLADWIASRENPLFARVIVNRLWHHHFGQGLVTTPSDFGFSGGQPSHPELLDYLASRLIESNWSLNTIHRLIVSSATWQQATTVNEAAEAIDAGNRLLWRGSRARLDAETLRDSILLAAGQLNDAVGGPSYQDFKTFNFNSQFYDMIDPVGDEFNRRTVYRMVIRSGRNRMLDAFDCPDPSATAPKRAVTTTPIQALSLLNHSFVLRMADLFAERIIREAGDDPNEQIDRAVQIVWCRAATADESDSFTSFAETHGLAALCRVLINSNEFLYVD